jgi:hypothetical protein
VLYGLLMAFVHLLPANCDEFATGFFFDKMPEIPIAVSSKPN